MARDTRRAFLDELARINPQFARAFEAAIQDVRSTAQRTAIEAAIKRGIETGDIYRATQEVIASLQLGPEFFAPLDRSMQDHFNAGAAYQLASLPEKPLRNTGSRLVVRFQGRHPRAEAWTRLRAAELVTEITESIREVARETIDEGIRGNRGYRKIATDLIGRTDGNELNGGLIGLHSRQAAAVRKSRDQLDNLDPAYFQRKLRDRRFDGIIKKAIRDGKPLLQADIDRITGRYADRLLKQRGATIARTEGNKAMNAGRAEAVQQMVDDGKILAEHVTIIWDATPDKRTRDSHNALSGKSVTWGEYFVSPITNASIRYPHDEFAPAAETINCRCSARFRIDWAAVVRWKERQEEFA